jgi:hypothetical protein
MENETILKFYKDTKEMITFYEIKMIAFLRHNGHLSK